MTEIKFWGSTYRGTAEADHGVFTSSIGSVYAGRIADGSARVGVATRTNGTTFFAECGADGEAHGRVLECYADRDTVYALYEHGSWKEHAVLYATFRYGGGRCTYNGKACRADYAPFVALQAKVFPIKARPPTAPLRPYAAFNPHRPPIHPSAIVLALAGAGNDPRRQGARPTPPSACMTLNRYKPQQLPNKCTARPTWTAHRAEGCTTHATQTTCVVHPSVVPCPPCCAVDPHAPPPFRSRAARRF
jgi:hypothetical protein